MSKLKLLREETESTEGRNKEGGEGGVEKGYSCELFVWFYQVSSE